jgi:hypothetical protein
MVGLKVESPISFLFAFFHFEILLRNRGWLCSSGTLMMTPVVGLLKQLFVNRKFTKRGFQR